jgi:hypothetical protein
MASCDGHRGLSSRIEPGVARAESLPSHLPSSIPLRKCFENNFHLSSSGSRLLLSELLLCHRLSLRLRVGCLSRRERFGPSRSRSFGRLARVLHWLEVSSVLALAEYLA